MSIAHLYGCKCDKETAHSFYGDGSPAPCPPEVPCATASAEWNAVRARFAIADEIRVLARNTGRSADAMERLVSKDCLLGQDFPSLIVTLAPSEEPLLVQQVEE